MILYYIQEGDKSLFNANRLLYKLRMKLNRGKKIEAEIYNVLGEIDKLELEKMEFDEFHEILFSKIDTLNDKTAEFLREEWKKITKLR